MARRRRDAQSDQGDRGPGLPSAAPGPVREGSANNRSRSSTASPTAGCPRRGVALLRFDWHEPRFQFGSARRVQWQVRRLWEKVVLADLIEELTTADAKALGGTPEGPIPGSWRKANRAKASHRQGDGFRARGDSASYHQRRASATPLSPWIRRAAQLIRHIVGSNAYNKLWY